MARTSKPLCVSVNPVPLRLGAKAWMSYGLTVGFDLLQSQVLVAEAEVWQSIPKELAHIGTLDMGAAKGQGEWLLAGSTFAPLGQALKSWHAQVTLAQHNKVIQVHGSRAWDGYGLSTAQPCGEVEMAWSASFGGPDFAENTKGCGRKLANGTVVVPSIEMPGSAWRNPNQAIVPACTLPLEVLHPARQRYGGSYGVDYLEKFFPGMPPDFDRRYFNLAPTDQRIETYWKGDEAYELRHWHAEHPLIAGTLPQLRAALWLGLGDQALQRVDTQLSTVWFFPNACMGVLVFHGLHPVQSMDGHDVKRVLAGLEHLNAVPGTQEHYESLWNKRTERSSVAAANALDDTVLCPAGYTTRFAELEAAMAGHRPSPSLARHRSNMAKQFEEAAESVEKSTLQMPKHGVAETVNVMQGLAETFRSHAAEIQDDTPHPNTLTDMAAYLETAMQSMQEKQESAEREIAMTPTPPPFDPEDMQELFAESEKIDFNEQTTQGMAGLRDMIAKMPEGPAQEGELSRAEALLGLQRMEQMLSRYGKTPEESMSKMQKMADAHQRSIADIPKMNSFADMQEMQKKMKNEAKLPSFREIDQTELAEASPQWASNQLISGIQDAHLRLSSRDMQGITLKKVNLVGCDFRKANLSNAKFVDCTFAGCDFSDADASAISLEKCQFQWCRIERLHAPGSNWKKGQFINCEGSETNFSQSKIEFCTWMNGNYRNSVWKQSDMKHCTSHELEFGSSDFSNVSTRQSMWSSCKLKESDWSGAKISRGSFAMSELPAQWKSASLTHVSLNGNQNENGNWHGATLESVDFSDANLRGCCFNGINAINIQMQHADLRDCDFSDAKIQHGLFIEADLRGCSFLNATLSHCTLSRSIHDEQTSFINADVSSSTMLPRREEQ